MIKCPCRCFIWLARSAVRRISPELHSRGYAVRGNGNKLSMLAQVAASAACCHILVLKFNPFCLRSLAFRKVAGIFREPSPSWPVSFRSAINTRPGAMPSVHPQLSPPPHTRARLSISLRVRYSCPFKTISAAEYLRYFPAPVPTSNACSWICLTE